MCESCPSVRLSVVAFLLKGVIINILHAYFKWENHNPGSTSKAELCTIRLLRIWHNSGFQISDKPSNYLNTIALRATLPCRCNLVNLADILKSDTGVLILNPPP